MGGAVSRKSKRVAPQPASDGSIQSVVPAATPGFVAATGPARASSSGTRSDGTVVATYPKNSVYEGQISDGKRHGAGTLTLSDGTKYEAEWVDDKRHGKGTEIFPDGTRFVGTYVNDTRSGYGVMSWPEGSQYSGQFQHGKANGEGYLLRTDGSVYKGQFVEDCMSGSGCMQWKEGVKYVGQFVANMREGTGTMIWTAGKWQSYEGSWKDGTQHGSGKLIDYDGQIFNGVFHWGKLVHWEETLLGQPESPAESTIPAPSYWINQDLATGFNDRKEVSDEFRGQIQTLLESTFKRVRTRDRAGQIPSSLRLVKCHRVENSNMWKRYSKARQQLMGRRPEGCTAAHELDDCPEVRHVRTQEVLSAVQANTLDQRFNEYFLWHGTTPEGAKGISSDGFKLSFAGTRAGTYFGRGCYFAECSSKSDEYAREGEDLLSGLYALLLCRVTCGSLFRITQADQSAIREAMSSGRYDAVMGDREATVGSYREFVIYEEELAYPEYVVLYERKFETPATS